MPGGTGLAAGSGGAYNPGTGATTGGSEGGVLPCDVDATLRAKCQSCHGAVPINGVPESLLSYTDTQAHAVSNPSQSVWL